jgi:hypothetical protein
MTVVMDPTKPYTSDGLGPWSRAAKEEDLVEGAQSRWGRRLRIRLTVCLGLRTTSDGDGDVDGGGHSIVFLSPHLLVRQVKQAAAQIRIHVSVSEGYISADTAISQENAL